MSNILISETYLNICRLCLYVGDVSLKWYSLTTQPEIMRKFTACFAVHISLDPPHPVMVCEACYNSIKTIYNFHQKIMETESLLCHYSSIGYEELEQFYNTLKMSNIIEKNNCSPNIDEAMDFVDTFDCDSILNEDSSFSIKEPETQPVETPSEPINDIVFKCLMCLETFDAKSNLVHHYNVEHKVKKTRRPEKKYTVITSGDTETYKCNLCGKVYDTKKAANRHMWSHDDQRPFACKICGRSYKTASEIIRHSRAHDGTRFFCSKNCGYSTAYHGALVQHEKKHESDCKYKCEICGKGFHVRTWYLQHQNIHTGVKPFVCDICGAPFHLERYLTAHKHSVHPQSSNVKRYVCTQCSLRCDSRKALVNHMKEHGIKTTFLCDNCGKTYWSAEQLKLHKRSHSDTKPYSCGQHSKVTTYKCTNCRKVFAAQNQFTIHKTLGICKLE